MSGLAATQRNQAEQLGGAVAAIAGIHRELERIERRVWQIGLIVAASAGGGALVGTMLAG